MTLVHFMYYCICVIPQFTKERETERTLGSEGPWPSHSMLPTSRCWVVHFLGYGALSPSDTWNNLLSTLTRRRGSKGPSS